MRQCRGSLRSAACRSLSPEPWHHCAAGGTRSEENNLIDVTDISSASGPDSRRALRTCTHRDDDDAVHHARRFQFLECASHSKLGCQSQWTWFTRTIRLNASQESDGRGNGTKTRTKSLKMRWASANEASTQQPLQQPRTQQDIRQNFAIDKTIATPASQSSQIQITSSRLHRSDIGGEMRTTRYSGL